jgi:hypothetical protein
MQAIIVWQLRRLLGWTKWKAASACSHFMLCPPYGANVARSLASRMQCGSATLGMAVALAPASTIRNIIEPLLGDFSITADDSVSVLTTYRKAVLSHDI